MSAYGFHAPHEQFARVVEAYRGGGGRLQVHLSWAEDEATALRIAREQWRSAILGSDHGWELATPAEFAEATAYVRPEDMRAHVLISADPSRHAQWLREYADLGFDEIHLHHVGRDQDRFLEVFGARVLPELA